MWRVVFCFFFIFMLQFAYGFNQQKPEICGNNTQRAGRSCATQILGHDSSNIDTCRIEYYPANSMACKAMNFSPITSNTYIGGIRLKPYILQENWNLQGQGNLNHAVLNITFDNIKWKTMKFRFQTSKQKNVENHCRDISLANNVSINDQSVLYYDCYWPLMDDAHSGQSHILDFEAITDDKIVNRGQYYFNVPSVQMLSPSVTEEEWLPFLYIEILDDKMRLHIMPSPPHLNISGYQIKIIKEADKGTHVQKTVTMQLKNSTHEVTYDYSLLNNGTYHFNVTPLHGKCMDAGEGCKFVESPKFTISSDAQSLNICIASITALIVAILFAYYIALRVVRRYWCRDYRLTLRNEIPSPTKVLVVYSPANRLHAECVASFVNYLRSEYGFDVMYDGDISNTAHGDPFLWAEEAFRLASHIMYIVGPRQETNVYNNIYEKPIITAHKDVDKLLLSLLRPHIVSKCRKDVLNVFFEHSNGPIPIETRHDKVFFLLKDWQKLIAYLSKNLLPKTQIMRSEKGRCFYDDLKRAKEMLNPKRDDVLVRCDKVNYSEKKILI